MKILVPVGILVLVSSRQVGKPGKEMADQFKEIESPLTEKLARTDSGSELE